MAAKKPSSKKPYMVLGTPSLKPGPVRFVLQDGITLKSGARCNPLQLASQVTSDPPAHNAVYRTVHLSKHLPTALFDRNLLLDLLNSYISQIRGTTTIQEPLRKGINNALSYMPLTLIPDAKLKDQVLMLHRDVERLQSALALAQIWAKCSTKECYAIERLLRQMRLMYKKLSPVFI